MTKLRDGFHQDFSASGLTDRREASRHDATRRPTRMVARVIGASEVRLLDISRRGVMLETQTRLQFGVKATIRFTTCDACVSVGALVVRSLVASVGEVVVYHTALTFDEELRLADVLAHQQPADADVTPIESIEADESDEANEADDAILDADAVYARDGSVTDDNGEIILDDVLNLLVTVNEDLESLQRRADAHGDA